MASDGYDEDWEDMEALASDEDTGAVSDGSLQGILHSILADSGSRSRISRSTSDGSVGSYGDDVFDEAADPFGEGEVEPPTDENNSDLAGGAHEREHEDDPHVKRPHDIVKNGQTLKHCTPERSCFDDDDYGSDEHGRGPGPADKGRQRDIECIKRGRAKPEDSHTCRSKEYDDDNNADHGNPWNSNTNSNNDANNDSNNNKSAPPDCDNKRHDTQSLFPSARWPTRQSVQSSTAYIFYACRAGDYPDVNCPTAPSIREEGGRQQRLKQRRRRRRWRSKTVKIRRQKHSSPSPQKVASRTVHENGSREEGDDASGGSCHGSSCYGPEGGDADDEDADDCGVGGDRPPPSSPTVAGRRRHHRTERNSSKETNHRNNKNINCGSSKRSGENNVHGLRTPVHYRRSGQSISTKGQQNGAAGVGGSGGVDSSGGLPILERDMREAMIAVWLAWGVRIDATRERLKTEEGRLAGIHRAETAKLGSSIRAGVRGGKGHGGITPEVLELIVREAALRETGESERANSVRREAIRTRSNHFARRKDGLNLRRPMLESALGKQQAAELLVVRNLAEARESKLARARDETVRLLQLYLSRARRLVTAGFIATAPKNRPKTAGCCQAGSPVFHEADLLRIGKVLLLAQDTANSSIERALPTNRRNGNVRGVGERDETVNEKVAYATLPPETKNERMRASEHIESPSLKSFCENNNKNIKSERLETARLPGGGQAEKQTALSRLLRRRQQVLNSNSTAVTRNAVVAAATQANVCLWCNPAPVRERQRRCAAAAGTLRQRHNTHQAAAPRPSIQPQQPKRWRQSRRRENGRCPPPSDDNLRGSKICGKLLQTEKGKHTATREAANTFRTSPSLSPPENTSDRTAAIVDAESEKSSSERFVQPGPPDAVSPTGESAFAGQDGGGRGYTAPTAFFCSWECAGRWNAKFSPVQARHERELKINIAAGRLVGK